MPAPCGPPSPCGRRSGRGRAGHAEGVPGEREHGGEKPGSRASPSGTQGARRRSKVSRAAARATKPRAVSTAMRPGKTLVEPAVPPKSASSIPRFVPDAHSTRFSRPSRPASAAVAREASVRERPGRLARRLRARPASRRPTAVLGTIAAWPGVPCMRNPTSKTRPASSAAPNRDREHRTDACDLTAGLVERDGSPERLASETGGIALPQFCLPRERVSDADAE